VLLWLVVRWMSADPALDEARSAAATIVVFGRWASYAGIETTGSAKAQVREMHAPMRGLAHPGSASPAGGRLPVARHSWPLAAASAPAPPLPEADAGCAVVVTSSSENKLV